MSFILDALRKSEHERQRSAVPGVAQVPFAVRRRETPRWALVAIGLLGSAVLALGIAWWQTTRTGADREAAAGTAPIERPLGETAPPAARMTRVEPPRTQPSPDEPAPTTAARDAPAPSAVTPPPPAPRSSPAVADTAAAAPAPRSAPAIGGATAAAPTLPNAAALAAEGIAVPMLKLTLHVFSENPAERFVFINGTRYREGQTLREGPQVVSIERAGVVLSQQGRRFLLAPQ